MSEAKTRAEIEHNIRTLEEAYHSHDNRLVSEYRGYIERGRCFVPYNSKDGIAFAPSKFIGYLNNSFETHEKLRSNHDPQNPRDGRKTNERLAEILVSHARPNPDMEKLFLEFCKRRVITPQNRKRKYWPLDSKWTIAALEPPTNVAVTNNSSLIDEKLASARASGDDEIAEILNDGNLLQTEKHQLILARKGQGQFRNDLIVYYGKCCATGCTAIDALKASHIKPWRESSHHERLDKFNGLLLTPNIDTLLDLGFISFSDKGTLLVSAQLPKDAKSILLANCSDRIQIHPQNIPYLRYHRQYCFREET